jgi:hypothetical protein
MRLTTGRMMVVVVLVAVNLVAIRALVAIPDFRGYVGIMPLIVAETGAIRCLRVRGRIRGFWVSFVVADALLAFHQASAVSRTRLFSACPGGEAWWLYDNFAERMLTAVWPTFFAAPTPDRLAIWMLVWFLPIGLLACLAGLVARWAFDLWTRQRAAAEDGPAPVLPPAE